MKTFQIDKNSGNYFISHVDYIELDSLAFTGAYRDILIYPRFSIGVSDEFSSLLYDEPRIRFRTALPIKRMFRRDCLVETIFDVTYDPLNHLGLNDAKDSFNKFCKEQIEKLAVNTLVLVNN